MSNTEKITGTLFKAEDGTFRKAFKYSKFTHMQQISLAEVPRSLGDNCLLTYVP